MSSHNRRLDEVDYGCRERAFSSWTMWGACGVPVPLVHPAQHTVDIEFKKKGGEK